MKVLIETDKFELQEAVGKAKVFGIAIHPMATLHPGEWAEKRVYFEDELKQAVKSLIGKPIFLDHKLPLDDCRVTEARWNDKENGVFFEASVSPEVAAKIRNGVIKKVSISINPWRQGGGLKFVDGIAPFGFEFDELSLLENLQSGDPQAWVKIVEAMESPEYIRQSIKQADLFREETFREMWINLERGIMGIYAMSKENGDSYELVELKFYKAKGWDSEKVSQFLTDNPQHGTQPEPTPVPAIAEAIIRGVDTSMPPINDPKLEELKRKRMEEQAKGEEIPDMLKRIRSRMLRD